MTQEALSVSPDTQVSEVKNLLKDQPPFCSVVVTNDKKPQGLVMSYQLDRNLGMRYGVPLFFNKNISLLMDAEPLIADADQHIGEIAQAAMNRDISKIYDDIIVTERGKVLGTVSVQRMLETLAKAEIRAREEAESTTRSKSEFLASMSHDIRTPMNAILGMADMLWESPLSREQQKYVSVFRSAGESLLDLINDILDLSKAESGQIELESIDFNLRELVDSVSEVMAVKVQEKNIELVSFAEPEVPDYLRGDPRRLRQILSNLLGNALKFTQQGEIVLWVENIRDGSKPEQISLRFSVQDSGIGIPPDKQKSIFDSFIQAETSTTREYGGTGLGLSICKRLVSLMDGDIWVESEPGVGSTFFFTARFDEPEELPDAPPAPNFSSYSMLIVDDNTTSRYTLDKKLAKLGAKAICLESGQDCMEAVRFSENNKKPFDLILLDANIPGEKWSHTAAGILEVNPQQNIVVMFTTDDISHSMDRAAQAGISAGLIKPVQEGELRDTVCRALEIDSPESRRGKSESPKSPEVKVPPMDILLAEDNENNRLLFSFYLQNTGHHVEMAENGEICYKKYIQGQYDIVFMDIDMPVMNGYRATDAIRQWEKEQKKTPVPIVTLTAHALKESVRRV